MGMMKMMLDDAHARFDPTAGIAERSGECYHLAGLFAIANDDAHLVHGSIQGYGHPRMAHAWIVLPGGAVWEPFTGGLFANWNEFASAEVHSTYSFAETRGNVLEHEHWGPWATPTGTFSPYKEGPWVGTTTE